MNKGPEILVVDDNKSFRRGLNLSFSAEGYSVTEAENGIQALKTLKEGSFDILISDIRMPGLSGLELLEKLKEMECDCPVIMITAHASVDVAVDAMKKGAFDFIEKPFKFQDIELKVKKALEKLSLVREVKKLSRENEYLKDEAKSEYDFENIVGKSKKMLEVYSLIKKIAASSSNVLIYGESGTGKELVARAVHYRSDRSNAPFIRINCSVYPENLLESELFGHEKGAFSGASKSRVGRFEIADGGSIFIDEIGELSAPAQIKLLNVIQEREFERIGDNKTRKVDVRIIAATNKDLAESVVNKQFREDLYYRLNVISITLPPLRERKEDIPALSFHFLKKYGTGKNALKKQPITGISKDALDILSAYHWPGNVRELENVIERAVVLAEGSLLETPDLPMAIRTDNHAERVIAENDGGNLQDKIADYEKAIIEKAFEKCNGVISKTAEELGVERNALRYKLKKYGFIALFLCAFLYSVFMPTAYAFDSDVKEETTILWSKISDIKAKIRDISTRQKLIERTSKEKSELLERKKLSGGFLPASADNEIQNLLKEIRDLSDEYTSLQKEKIRLSREISDYSEQYIKAGSLRIKMLTENIRKTSSGGETPEWIQEYREIEEIEKNISQVTYSGKSRLEIIDGNIEISIFRNNPNNIDRITEEIEYIDEGVSMLIQSLDKLHSRLEYLYNVKEAKERLSAMYRRIHSGDRLKPSELAAVSNLEKDIKSLEDEIEIIKNDISLSEIKIKEFKKKYAELEEMISSYEDENIITENKRKENLLIPAKSEK